MQVNLLCERIPSEWFGAPEGNALRGHRVSVGTDAFVNARYWLDRIEPEIEEVYTYPY